VAETVQSPLAIAIDDLSIIEVGADEHRLTCHLGIVDDKVEPLGLLAVVVLESFHAEFVDDGTAGAKKVFQTRWTGPVAGREQWSEIEVLGMDWVDCSVFHLHQNRYQTVDDDALAPATRPHEQESFALGICHPIYYLFVFGDEFELRDSLVNESEDLPKDLPASLLVAPTEAAKLSVHKRAINAE
jgi:hypothetical protein